MVKKSEQMKLERAIIVLRNARYRIYAKQNTMLCLALDECRGDTDVKTYLKRWVGRMLGVHTTYGKWLQANHPEKLQGVTMENVSAFMRECRLEWIDWMISELEKELANG